jgi:hypothetical protein
VIKEALQYLIGLGTTNVTEVGGQEFSTQPIHLIKQPTASSLTVRNLAGIVDYLVSEYDQQPPVLIQVASPTKVDVFSTFNRDMHRNHLISAQALLPEITFERFMDVESFNILLQSCFVSNDDRTSVLRLVGNIREDNVRTTGDNGVSQEVTAKVGVAAVDNVPVPNPVKLKPFRTFVEISQPESAFVFRLQNGPKAALFEADGGEWKLQAIRGIREYLDEKLAGQIVDKKVTIIS